MAAIQRRDPYLNEALEILDVAFIRNKQDVRKTLASLGSTELAFIDMERERCALDERYYLENYHVIQDADEIGFKSLYPFWDSQELFLEAFYRRKLKRVPIKILILKARQLGISTISQALIFQKTIFTEGCNTLVVAQDPGQADYLFNMSRRAYESLPWWLKPERRYEAKGKYLTLDRNDSEERFFSPGLRSEMFVEAANKVSGVAVGKGINAFSGSELSLWATSTVLTQQILPTLEGRNDILAILESTARGRDNFFYEFWKGAMSGDMDWDPVFIESFRVSRYHMDISSGENFELNEEEKGVKERIQNEVGVSVKDEHFKWRRYKMREFENAGDEFGFFGEYPTSWVGAFQSTGECAFNKRKLIKILSACLNPVYYGEIDLDDEKLKMGDMASPRVKLRSLKKMGLSKPPRSDVYGSRFYVWEPPEDGESYYVAADVGRGVKGGDYSTVEVIRIGKGIQPDFQVAEWHGLIHPEPFGNVIVAIGYWYNEAQVAVECNDVGILTNNTIFRVLEYPNVFRWKQYDKLKHFFTDFFGWYTNMKTRPQIISKMAQALDEDTTIIRSSWLVDELFDFGLEGKRYEALEGKDDLCMAMCIANFCAHDTEWAIERAGDPQRNLTDSEKAEMRRKDFANSDYSPLHDGPMIRGGIPCNGMGSQDEDYPKDVRLYQQMGENQDCPEDDKWKTF